jgi:hypothetical protein
MSNRDRDQLFCPGRQSTIGEYRAAERLEGVIHFGREPHSRVR